MKRRGVDIKKAIRKRIEIDRNKRQELVYIKTVSMNKRDWKRVLGDSSKPPITSSEQKCWIVDKDGEFMTREEKRSGVVLPKYYKLKEAAVKLFSKPYKKDETVDYDTVVLITSYDRFDMVYEILTQLYRQKTEYKFKVVLVDDCSSDERYDALTTIFPKLVFLKNEENYGKKGYWKTVMKGLEEVRKCSTNSILQLDDDFMLCESFLNRLMTEYYQVKKNNNKVLCLSFHNYMKDYLNPDKFVWGYKYWVDGGGLYDVEFIKLLDYKIDEISESRWKYNKNVSAGVWQQMTTKINTMGCVIYKTLFSYVKNIGLIESKMHGGVNNIDPENSDMKTVNFIDE